MPRGDRTGPWGRGPMTGRGLGFCAGYDGPGFGRGFGREMGYGRGFGRGRGMGYGRGFGRGRGYAPPFRDYGPYSDDVGYEPAPEDERTYLEKSLEYLEEEVQAIKDRLKELAPKKK